MKGRRLSWRLVAHSRGKGYCLCGRESSRKVGGMPVRGGHRMGLEGTVLSGETDWDFYT